MSSADVEREGSVARIWLNRTERHNALSPQLIADLAEALRALAHDDTVRVVVLGGRGASLCAGTDIGVMKDSAHATFDDNLAEAEKLARMFSALARLPKPVVGRIHGDVLGGGIGLAAACDIAVASSDAVFALTEVRLGVLPALISSLLLRRTGDRNVRELVLTGEKFDAASALRIGLVDHVVPPAELDAKVEERVLALMQGAPGAQGRIKTLLDLWADSPPDDFRAALPLMFAEVRSGAEAREGFAAFLEERKAAWMEPE